MTFAKHAMSFQKSIESFELIYDARLYHFILRITLITQNSPDTRSPFWSNTRITSKTAKNCQHKPGEVTSVIMSRKKASNNKFLCTRLCSGINSFLLNPKLRSMSKKTEYEKLRRKIHRRTRNHILGTNNSQVTL